MYEIVTLPNALTAIAVADKYRVYDASADEEKSVPVSLVVMATDDVTEAAPTDAELDTAFGTPATVGAGFVGIIKDNDADTASILCWSTGAAWFHAVGVKST